MELEPHVEKHVERQVGQALVRFAEHPIARVSSWVIKGLFGALVTVSTGFVAYYAGDMRDSIDELKTTVKTVIERVDKLEREADVRRAQWEAYREVYVDDVRRYRERQDLRAAEQESAP
jgi:hypothetical protein